MSTKPAAAATPSHALTSACATPRLRSAPDLRAVTMTAVHPHARETMGTVYLPAPATSAPPLVDC